MFNAPHLNPLQNSKLLLKNLIPLLSKICNEKEIKERNARSVSGDSEHKVQSNLKSIFIAKENQIINSLNS